MNREAIEDRDRAIKELLNGEQERMCKALDLIGEFVGEKLILSICLECFRPYGVKDGGTVSGLSHGYCPDCKMEVLTRLKNR